ncbi:UNVERIFIED_CONTAM: hypothetical protein NCL1_16650 [Trichonephila clavipes]
MNFQTSRRLDWILENIGKWLPSVGLETWSDLSVRTCTETSPSTHGPDAMTSWLTLLELVAFSISSRQNHADEEFDNFLVVTISFLHFLIKYFAFILYYTVQ